MFIPQGFYWLFLSPIILYSYFLTNLFGFKRELFLIIDLSSKKKNYLIKVYLGFVFVVLPIDLIIFFSFIIINNQFTYNNILYYFISFVPLSYLGFIVAFWKAKFINDSSSFKISNKNVPIIGNILLAASIVILYFLKSNIIFQVAYLFLFSTLICYSLSLFRKTYKKYKYNLYENLFSNSN